MSYAVYLYICISMSSAHFPTFPSLHLGHNSFSNPSIALPTSQLILQPFRRFTCITAHSPTFLLLHLCHSSFYNPSVASPTSQALHLRHLASCPCFNKLLYKLYSLLLLCMLYICNLVDSKLRTFESVIKHS